MVLRVRPNPRFARSSRATVTVPTEQKTVAAPLPAPILGVNYFDSLAMMQPGDAVYCYNMDAGAYGLTTRRGYREHADDAGNAIRSLAAFEDDTVQLYAMTVDGIFSVTAGGTIGAALVSWPTASGNAGFGVTHHYKNDGAGVFIIFADEVNGLYEADMSGPTWAAKADITGVAESDLVWVTEHQERLWFVERSKAVAWYTAPGAKGGAVTKFDLGPKFPRGGDLHGIYRWSVDGGDGIDDLLVFVSKLGDVTIFQGTDPSSVTTWSSLGTWNIGKVPDSRNIGFQIGGELHLLSVYGMLSMQDLVNGIDLNQATGQSSKARKITRLLTADMQSGKLDRFEWMMLSSQKDNSNVLIRPGDTGVENIQYVFNFTTSAWTFWRGVPMTCAVEWQGDLYFGDEDGNVHYMASTLDGIAQDGSGGDPIKFSLLTAFNQLGHPGQHKQVQFCRPHFFSESGGEPSYNTIPFYDYNIEEGPNVVATAGNLPNGWDVGLWDVAVWGGGSATFSELISTCASADGFTAAIALFGQTRDRTTLLDIVVYFQPGGYIG